MLDVFMCSDVVVVVVLWTIDVVIQINIIVVGSLKGFSLFFTPASVEILTAMNPLIFALISASH